MRISGSDTSCLLKTTRYTRSIEDTLYTVVTENIRGTRLSVELFGLLLVVLLILAMSYKWDKVRATYLSLSKINKQTKIKCVAFREMQTLLNKTNGFIYSYSVCQWNDLSFLGLTSIFARVIIVKMQNFNLSWYPSSKYSMKNKSKNNRILLFFQSFYLSTQILKTLYTCIF